MKRSAFQVVFAILFVIGLFFVLKSVSWGSDSANAYLRAHGGSMDTTKFMVIFQEYISTYRIFGIILAIIGGFGLLRSIKFLEKDKSLKEN